MPEASLLGILNVLLRRRWAIILPALAVLAVTLTWALVRPRTYTATAAFVPQVDKAGSALEGLSSRLNLNLGSGDPMQSPQFYVALMESREILRGVAETRYRVPTAAGEATVTLAELYEPKGETPELRRDALLRKVARQVEATQSQPTGIVEVSVTTPYRELSAQMTERILALVNDFNLQTRQSQARAERRFVEQRLADVRAELRAMEGRQQSFLQRNRDFGLSSALAIERERLEREVAMHRALYAELAQNFERARMEEVRDTPVITVLERPEVPARADSRKLVRHGLLALIAGGLLGILVAFTREYLQRVRDGEAEDYEQFTRLRHESLRDITHPWSAVTRLVRGRSR